MGSREHDNDLIAGGAILVVVAVVVGLIFGFFVLDHETAGESSGGLPVGLWGAAIAFAPRLGIRRGRDRPETAPKLNREPRVRTVATGVLFVIGLLSVAACLIFTLVTVANPYNDITRAWTMIFAAVSAVVSAGAWVGVWLVGRRHRSPTTFDSTRGQESL